jgi:hypothetical protein
VAGGPLGITIKQCRQLGDVRRDGRASSTVIKPLAPGGTQTLRALFPLARLAGPDEESVSMTHLKALLVSAAAIALLFGLEFPDPKLIGEPSPLPNDHTMVLAANEGQSTQPQTQIEENSDESAKMGKEAGAQTGNQAVPESDTKKVDQ